MQRPVSAEAWKKAPDKKTVIWLVLLYVATDLIGLALGVGYVLIVVGLHVIARLAVVHFVPARKKFFTWLGKHEKFSPPPSMTWWRTLSITLNLIVTIGMVVYGSWIIFQNTFCQQNLICLLAHNP